MLDCVIGDRAQWDQWQEWAHSHGHQWPQHQDAAAQPDHKAWQKAFENLAQVSGADEKPPWWSGPWPPAGLLFFKVFDVVCKIWLVRKYQDK